MPIKMKNLPVTERPYEKLEQYGEKNLTNAELLAIIIKSGTREETNRNKYETNRKIFETNLDNNNKIIAFYFVNKKATNKNLNVI